jgi:hypothetical protein
MSEIIYVFLLMAILHEFEPGRCGPPSQNRTGTLRARRLFSPLAWGILASWMLWAVGAQTADFNEVRSPKNPAIPGLMRLNFLSIKIA